MLTKEELDNLKEIGVYKLLAEYDILLNDGKYNRSVTQDIREEILRRMINGYKAEKELSRKQVTG